MVDVRSPYHNWLSPGSLPGLSCAGSMDKAETKAGHDGQLPGSNVNFGIFPLPCIVNDCVDQACCKNGRGPTNPKPAPVLWATRHQNGSITVDRALPPWQRHKTSQPTMHEGNQTAPAQLPSRVPVHFGGNGANGLNVTIAKPASGPSDPRPAEAPQSLPGLRQGGAIKNSSKAPKYWPYQRPHSPESAGPLANGKDLTTATWRAASSKAADPPITANRPLGSTMDDSGPANQAAAMNLDSTDGAMDLGPGLLVSLRNGPGNHTLGDPSLSKEGSQLGLSLRQTNPCSQSIPQTAPFGKQTGVSAAVQDTGLRDSDAEIGDTGAVVQAVDGDSLLTLKLFTEAPSIRLADAPSPTHPYPSRPAPTPADTPAPVPAPAARREGKDVPRGVMVAQGGGQGGGRRKSYLSVVRRQIYVLPTPEDGIVRWLKYGQKCIRKGDSARDRGYFKCGTGSDFKCPAHKWEDRMNGGFQVTYVKDHNDQCMRLQLELRAAKNAVENAKENPKRRSKFKPTPKSPQELLAIEPDKPLEAVPIVPSYESGKEVESEKEVTTRCRLIGRLGNALNLH